MLTSDDISDFIAGRLGKFLKLTYDGDDGEVIFERKDSDLIIARVPVAGPPLSAPFSIEMALALPACGVEFERLNGIYVLVITRRHQLWSAMKIAMNHLNWIDERRLRVTIGDD